MNKKIKKGDLSVSVLLVIGIIVVLNFFSYKIFAHFDLTENKAYSISKVSKNTVGKLDDVVNVNAYFSKNLPSQLISTRQEVTDILNEYAAYSGGKIRIEYIDPGTDQDAQMKMAQLGIPQINFEVFEKDKRQLINGYFGLTITFGEKTEAIPVVKSDTSDLEYQLTTAIKKVISEKIATIGYLKDHKTATTDEEFAAGYKSITELYTVEDVEITDKNPNIPDTVNTLVVVAPKEKFTDKQIEAIKKFVNNGGALLVLADGVKMEKGMQPVKNDIALDKLSGAFGLKFNQDLVADQRSGLASFSQGFFSFTTPYVLWPKFDKSGFNANETSVSRLADVVLHWASSIDIVGKDADKNYTKLAFTSAKGWALKDLNVAPNTITAPADGTKETAVAVMVGPKAQLGVDDKAQSMKGKAIFVGDADFAQDRFLSIDGELRQGTDNMRFFQNLVDTLSLDGDLIAIRSKIVSSRPIQNDIPDAVRLGMRYANIFGVTLLVVGYGMIRYFMRRKSRFTDKIV